MIASHCPPLLRAGYGLRAIARTCSQGKDSSRSTSRGNVASCATHSFGSASTWCGARTAARNGSIVRGRNACTAAWARLGDRREPLCSRSVGHPTTSTSTSPSLPTPRSQVSWMPSKPIRHAGSTRRSRGSSHFAWQKGYSAFSVCRRCERAVIRYIRYQEAHHGPAREGGVDGD